MTTFRFSVLVSYGLAIILCLGATASAQGTRYLFDGREVQSNGFLTTTHFGPDQLEGTDDDQTRFSLTIVTGTEPTASTEFVPLADDLFEEFSMPAALQASVGRINFEFRAESRHGPYSLTETVQYNLGSSGQWTRVSHLEVPVAPSTAQPLEPYEDITLQSGDVVRLYPILHGYLWRGDADGLSVRVGTSRDWETLRANDPLIASIWDEVVLPRVEQMGGDKVSLEVIAGYPQRRFHFPPSIRLTMGKQQGAWPSMGYLVEYFSPWPEEGVVVFDNEDRSGVR